MRHYFNYLLCAVGSHFCLKIVGLLIFKILEGRLLNISSKYNKQFRDCETYINEKGIWFHRQRNGSLYTDFEIVLSVI